MFIKRESVKLIYNKRSSEQMLQSRSSASRHDYYHSDLSCMYFTTQ